MRKPFISKKNKTARLEFVSLHKDWSVKDWSKVLFSDESKFNLFGSDGGHMYDDLKVKDTIVNTRFLQQNMVENMLWCGEHFLQRVSVL